MNPFLRMLRQVVMCEQCASDAIKGTLLVHGDYFNVIFCVCMHVCVRAHMWKSEGA